MFEKEAYEYREKGKDEGYYLVSEEMEQEGLDYIIDESFKDGAEFGYNKGKEELTERLDEAKEIIEQMKDLFFTCWQEKGYNAIKFEQKVNDFLKE